MGNELSSHADTLHTPGETTRWIDNQGDIWTLGDDGLMHTPETAAFPREHVEKKWGPLKPLGEQAAGERMTTQPAGQLCGCQIFTTHPTHGNPWCTCGHQYSDHTPDGATCTMIGQTNPEPVIYWCPTAREIEQKPGGGFDVCCHAPELHEPILTVVYAAIRQHVAEQIAGEIAQHQAQFDATGVVHPELDVAIQIAREIGGGQ